jgi:L-cysteine desulfidase
MNSHFFEILKREMVLALGCTEPVALAWAGAVVKKHLGAEPKRMVARCSPNIIKNVKSVIVPNTNGMKGIDVACVVGACFGDAESGLETLATMNEDKIARCAEKVAQIPCQIEILETNATLHFIIEGYYQDEVVGVEIKDEHTRIVQITRNGNVLQKAQERRQKHGGDGVEVGYSVKEIINFARTVDYSPLQTLLRRSIECNLAIAREGLQKDYGINVGKTILSMNDGGVRSEAKSYAAAASDARMSGCSLPVMINSGSGNQGITVSIPVIMYARHVNASEESLYRRADPQQPDRPL